MKTRYYFEGREIRHTQFLSIMRSAGLQSGYKESHFEHLTRLANSGNEKAQLILSKLTVE